MEQPQTEYKDGRLKDGTYQKISAFVREWLDLHKGETFNLDTVCRQLEIQERENRKYVAIELARKVEQEKLEKVGSSYRFVDKTVKNIDWVNASEEQTLDITWPHGREEDTNEDVNSYFDFQGSVVISPKDVIVIAGVSNMGKTCFCLNFLWDNMDKYPCSLMGSEYSAVKFKRRVSRMTWNNPLKEDGTPKFELIERYDNWKDIIRPNNINIIDWVTVNDGEFYKIGSLIQGIHSKLDKGIALISLQKSSTKSLGEGGDFSVRLASFYLTLDFEKANVVKAKEWTGKNPNNQMYGFTIIEGGTRFHNIRPIKKCPKCWTTGKVRGVECEDCRGKGYIDA